jgi:hypothetical protein
MATSTEPSGNRRFDGTAHAQLSNPVRSTVSAFEPLPVCPELAELIVRALGH